MTLPGLGPVPGSGASRWPPGFVSGRGDREALAVLLGLPSVTPRRLFEAAGTSGSARRCLDEARAGRLGSPADRERALAQEGKSVLSRVRSIGARMVSVGDAEYPAELLDLFDPPAGLFIRGREVPELQPRVAIVGARHCSPGGQEIATVFGAALARAGVCVVSGGARGIDSAAHRGALDAGGASISVMGCGIDVAYPRQNRRLLERMADSGALVSEYPPGVPAEPFRFPARNRIVAALSRAVVVVEGAAGSGSMITADHALDIGREVYAVPGTITNPLSFVPHALIRDGATLTRGPDDLLADLGLAVEDAAGSVSAVGLAPDLSEAQRRVWDSLAAPSHPDSLLSATGLSLPEIVSALVALELRGLVRQVGGRYERRLTGGGSS